MKVTNLVLMLSLSMILISCMGDKKSLIGQSFGDTSFINASFKGDPTPYEAIPDNLCSKLPKSLIQKYFPESNKILYDDGKTFKGKNCRCLVYLGEGEFEYVPARLSVREDAFEDPEAWIEQWELLKLTSKSSEYIPDLGKAAIWKESKKELTIKMDKYDIYITTPYSNLFQEGVQKEKDHKAMAIEIAKQSGLL